MKFKKPRGLLLGIGIGAFVVAAVLFFLIPVICRDGFQYNGLSALVEGLKALGTFNFVNVLYTSLLILFVLVFALIVLYAVVSVQKKHKSHLLIDFLSLILIFGSYVTVSVYFLADVEFNGTVGKLLDSMLKVDGQIIGKILSSTVLALAILSNVMLVVHAFVAMISMVVTKEVKDFEENLESSKEAEIQEKVAEIIASQPAPEPVVVQETATEQVAVQEVTCEEEQESKEDFEARKAREEQIFKECIDSGYFTEYEELEFPEVLEGFDEEPVAEVSYIEEKSAVINKSSVHVGYSHR